MMLLFILDWTQTETGTPAKIWDKFAQKGITDASGNSFNWDLTTAPSSPVSIATNDDSIKYALTAMGATQTGETVSASPTNLRENPRFVIKVTEASGFITSFDSVGYLDANGAYQAITALEAKMIPWKFDAATTANYQSLVAGDVIESSIWEAYKASLPTGKAKSLQELLTAGNFNPAQWRGIMVEKLNANGLPTALTFQDASVDGAGAGSVSASVSAYPQYMVQLGLGTKYGASEALSGFNSAGKELLRRPALAASYANMVLNKSGIVPQIGPADKNGDVTATDFAALKENEIWPYVVFSIQHSGGKNLKNNDANNTGATGSWTVKAKYFAYKDDAIAALTTADAQLGDVKYIGQLSQDSAKHFFWGRNGNLYHTITGAPVAVPASSAANFAIETEARTSGTTTKNASKTWAVTISDPELTTWTTGGSGQQTVILDTSSLLLNYLQESMDVYNKHTTHTTVEADYIITGNGNGTLIHRNENLF